MTLDTKRIAIANGPDIAHAVVEAQHLLQSLRFDRNRTLLVATAVSELARNVLVHGGGGTISLCRLAEGDTSGFEVVAEDDGPGIADLGLAFTEGYSTRHSLGLGLPGVRRIMDEVQVDPDRQVGTRITARKWR